MANITKGLLLGLLAGALAVEGANIRGSNFISFSEADSYAVLKKEEKVEIARNNPGYRQRFLDEIVSNYDFKDCSAVVYDPTGTNYLNYLAGVSGLESDKLVSNIIFPLNKETDFEVVVPRTLASFGKGGKVPIFVGKKFFEGTNGYFRLDSDVKNYLTLFAYPQCKIHSEGFPGVSSSLVVSNFNQGKIDPAIIDRINDLYANYCAVLGFFEGKDQLSREYMSKMSYDFLMDKLYLNKMMTKGVSSMESNMIKKVFRDVKGIKPEYSK